MVVVAASVLLVAILAAQALEASGALALGLGTWRLSLYAYLIWAVALGVGQVVMRGEAGYKALFLLPALLFTVALVIFPTIF